MKTVARNTELWCAVFGSAPDSWGWSEIEFLEGDWDQPGRVKVTFFDPDEPEFIIATRELTMDLIWEALDDVIAAHYVDACTGRPIHETCDWDACSSDTLLQVAVLGKPVFA